MKIITHIELTNNCNRNCIYCGIPTMTRSKGFMSDETFNKTLELLTQLNQSSLIVTFYGEETLHPNLITHLQALNSAGIRITLATNGDFLTDTLLAELATIDFESFIISQHGDRTLVDKCTEAGIKNCSYQDDLTEIMVDLNCTIFKSNDFLCPYIKKEHGIVLWDGNITTCCVDYDGKGIYGNVFDIDILSKKANTFSLCSTCGWRPKND